MESQTVDQVAAAVESLFKEVIQEGNFEAGSRILTPDFQFQYPFPGFPAGREGIYRLSEVLRGAFSGLRLDIAQIFGAEGQAGTADVAIRWTAFGSHTGEFLGIAPTNENIAFSAIGIYTGGGDTPGQLRQGWLELDALRLLQQLRVIREITTLLPGLRDLD